MQIRRTKHHKDEPGMPKEREGQSNSQGLVFSARRAIRRIMSGTLPAGATIIGNLTFPNAITATIPPETHISGSILMLWMSDVKLGEGLTVAGDADFSMSEIEQFPKRMAVGGDLTLMSTTVHNKLPDDLKVGGLIHLGEYASQELWDRAAEAKRNYDGRQPDLSGIPKEKGTVAEVG